MLCLYSKLGFRTREPLSIMRGAPPKIKMSGYDVRPAREGDVAACNALFRAVHGHTRAGEVAEAVREGTATVVERLGRLNGYATAIGFFAHAVSEANEDMIALMAAAPGSPGLASSCRRATTACSPVASRMISSLSTR
jgi:hypothetical protein